MKTKLFLSLVIILGLFLSACSSSEETTKQNEEPEVYVFDDISDVDTTSSNNFPEIVPPNPQIIAPSFNYIVQVAAFTTEDRATTFIDQNKNKIEYPMSYFYSDAVQLWVVQLPSFENREDAETVRNNLWQTKEFKDAFIVTKE